MSHVADWIRGNLAGGREENQEPGGNVVPGALLHNIIAEQARHGLPVVTHSTERLIDDHGAPLGVPAGECSGVLGFSPHTRPLRRAQLQLQVQELATANRRKDELLAMISHELRSPLASIQNAVRVLGAQAAEAPMRQRAQALIERQVFRMTQLVDDLLDVSRISRGRLHLHCERIDLRVVVSNAIETLESDIKNTLARIQNHQDPAERKAAADW